MNQYTIYVRTIIYSAFQYIIFIKYKISMNKLYSLLFAFSAVTLSSATLFLSPAESNYCSLVQFPQADELRKTLNDLDQTHFVRWTTIVENLAGKKLNEKQIKDHVVNCSNQYCNNLQSNGLPPFLLSEMQRLQSFRENNITKLLIDTYKE